MPEYEKKTNINDTDLQTHNSIRSNWLKKANPFENLSKVKSFSINIYESERTQHYLAHKIHKPPKLLLPISSMHTKQKQID